MTTSVQEPAVDAARPELWRITDRGTFDALRKQGRRARRGPLSVTHLVGADDQPRRAAFTVGRGAGGAVLRNRVRRRLRAALRQLLAEGSLPGGTYLIGAGADVATMPWTALLDQLRTLVAEVAG